MTGKPVKRSGPPFQNANWKICCISERVVSSEVCFKSRWGYIFVHRDLLGLVWAWLFLPVADLGIVPCANTGEASHLRGMVDRKPEAFL